MWLIRLIAITLLIMFAFPYLGLLGFHGGVLGGIGAAVLTVVVDFCVTVVLFPLLATFGLGAIAAGGVLGGQLGARVVGFGITTGLYTLALYAVAAMLSGVALIGFWPTVGAAALLSLVSVVLARRQSTQS